MEIQKYSPVPEVASAEPVDASLSAALKALPIFKFDHEKGAHRLRAAVVGCVKFAEEGNFTRAWLEFDIACASLAELEEGVTGKESKRKPKAQCDVILDRLKNAFKQTRLVILASLCLGGSLQAQPVMPAVETSSALGQGSALSLAFDELAPPPWFQGTNWTNFPEHIQARLEIGPLPPGIQTNILLHMPVQTNFPSWMIQYSPNLNFNPWYDLDLIDRSQLSYDLTYYLTNRAIFLPLTNVYFRAKGWYYPTPGAHQR